MSCPVCGDPPVWTFAHCSRCTRSTCGKAICNDIQDAVCEGYCVHEYGSCYRCGDIIESGCSPKYEVEREPRLVEV